jgi:hypothetical protein
LPTSLRYSFYLACSWLWCLGGFFPLILSRDYGWPAIAAFTIFNLGGATAMGFYFKQRAHQQSFERRHKSAIGVFSYVTIAYQLVFMAWLGAAIDQPLLLPCVLAIVFVIYMSKGFITYWAVILYLLSLGLFITFFASDWPPVDFSAKGYWPHALLPLAIGFILSPYLDITFHRAYKNSSNPQLSFALGFCILFLSLLAFVFVYAGSLSEVFFNQGVPSAVIYPVVGFLILQIAFTIAAHCGELSTHQYIKPTLLGAAIVVVSLLAFCVVTFLKGATIPWLNLALEETLYKSFLFFYSLVFPLYLVLGKIKTIYLWVLGICTPAYSVGFLIGGEYSYSLSLGVAIMLLAFAYRKLKKWP